MIAARSAAVPGLKRATGTVPGSSSGGSASCAAARAGSKVSTARWRMGSGRATLLCLQKGGAGFALNSEQGKKPQELRVREYTGSRVLHNMHVGYWHTVRVAGRATTARFTVSRYSLTFYGMDRYSTGAPLRPAGAMSGRRAFCIVEFFVVAF